MVVVITAAISLITKGGGGRYLEWLPLDVCHALLVVLTYIHTYITYIVPA